MASFLSITPLWKCGWPHLNFLLGLLEMLRRSSPSPIKSGRHYLTHLDEPTAGTLRLLSTPSSIWSVLLLTYILLQGKENLLLNFLKVCSIFYGLIVFWGFSSCLLRELGLWAVAVVGPESPLRPWIGYWVIQTNLTWHDLTDWNHKKYDFSLCRYPFTHVPQIHIK